MLLLQVLATTFLILPLAAVWLMLTAAYATRLLRRADRRGGCGPVAVCHRPAPWKRQDAGRPEDGVNGRLPA